MMRRAPSELDGARVLRWAISAQGAFHGIGEIAIPAMAICQYAPGGAFYLFKCAEDWRVVGDWDGQTIDECMEIAALHAKGQELMWRED